LSRKPVPKIKVVGREATESMVQISYVFMHVSDETADVVDVVYVNM
jgi:hypothetical protein